MRYLSLLLLLAGCVKVEPGYTTSTMDVSKSPECSSAVTQYADYAKETPRYVRMRADNGDVLYFDTHDGHICLRRHR